MVREGGTVLCLDVPEGTEIGIDYVSWRAGPQFMGVKMIPPGVHFFYYSARSTTTPDMAPRTGMFLRATPGHVTVLKWSKFGEDFVHESAMDPVEVSARKAAAARFEFDRQLGAYPHKGFQTWRRLSNWVSAQVLDRVEPVGRAIVSAASRYEKGTARTPQEVFDGAMRLTMQVAKRVFLSYCFSLSMPFELR